MRSLRSRFLSLFVGWLTALLSSYTILAAGAVAGGTNYASEISYSDVRNLSNDRGQSKAPQLTATDTDVYVAWQNEFRENSDNASSLEHDIVFRKGSDYGESFNKAISLTDSSEVGEIYPVKVAASGSSVYLAWNNGSSVHVDEGSSVVQRSNADVFLISSTACAEQPFSAPAMISRGVNAQESTVAEPPELVASASYVYALWRGSNQEGNADLFFKRSSDNGATFDKTIRLTSDDKLSSASVSSYSANANLNVVSVVWAGYNGTGDKGVFLKRSLDYGQTFERTIALYVHGSDGIVGIPDLPEVASSNGNSFVVWRDNYYGSNGNFILYMKTLSSHIGVDHDDVITLSDKTREATSPQIAAFENNVYITWEDKTDPDKTEILFRSSADGGKTFGDIIPLSEKPGRLYHSRLTASGSSVFVVWASEDVGNGDIILRSSTDNGAHFEEATNLSNNEAGSAAPELVAPLSMNGIAYVAWEDYSPGNSDIFFRVIGRSQNGAENPATGLWITEVELSSANGTQWIEVYNPTTQRLSTGAMLVNGSNVSFQFDGSSYSYAYVQPRQYQIIGLNYSAMSFDQLNQTISIYDTWSGNPLYWDKTPPLTDTFSDSRTWQRNSTDYWVFEEQTPMRAIPEFSNTIIMFLTASALIGAVVMSIRFRAIN